APGSRVSTYRLDSRAGARGGCGRARAGCVSAGAPQVRQLSRGGAVFKLAVSYRVEPRDGSSAACTIPTPAVVGRRARDGAVGREPAGRRRVFAPAAGVIGRARNAARTVPHINSSVLLDGMFADGDSRADGGSRRDREVLSGAGARPAQDRALEGA